MAVFVTEVQQGLRFGGVAVVFDVVSGGDGEGDWIAGKVARFLDAHTGPLAGFVEDGAGSLVAVALDVAAAGDMLYLDVIASDLLTSLNLRT